MTVVYLVLGIVAIILLVLLEATQPAHTTISLFELRRRRAAKNEKAIATLRREELLVQLSVLKVPLVALLLVGLTLLLLASFGEVRGILAALATALLYARFARTRSMRRLAGRLYQRHEERLLAMAAQYEQALQLLGGRTSLSRPTPPLESREELAHLIGISTIFSDEDKKLLEHALTFNDRTVGEVMVKKSSMVTVRSDELLGPLVLDDLHKTKHELFPVEENDTIVGLLDIRDHVALRRKESVYVRDVMHAGIVRIAESEPLDEALRVLIAAKQPYLVVINDNEQVVGMLGLGDVIRALTGWNRR